MPTLFKEIYDIILLEDSDDKCEATQSLYKRFDRLGLHDDMPPQPIVKPGYPQSLEFVAPRELKKRGIQSQEGRNILMHSIAHIEYNAINLALDAAYRYRGQPQKFYSDWIKVAADEARHFSLINEYLECNHCFYGQYPVHDGLWEMTSKTAHDIVARMALVPRVLEARGLDVTPSMINKLSNIGDDDAASILKVIYDDEIEHVRIGSIWFTRECQQRELNPRETFFAMIDQYFVGELKGPFNIAARLKAGFDESELAQLSNRSQV